MAESTIHASVLHGARDLRVEVQSLPPLAVTDVRVAVRATGLCGSDLHYFNHFRNGDIVPREPMTLGHESAGEVIAIGSAVTLLQVGDRVALEVGQPCEACALCKDGRYNICRGMRFRSSAKGEPPYARGTLQESIVHPEKWCHKLPSSVSLEQGALVEPLSVAMHASDRAKLPPDSTVLVMGAGAVGLLCAAMSKVNHCTVVVADIQAERVNFALENGFAHAGVVVPRITKRPETIQEQLAYAQEVAAFIKATKVGEQEVGEVKGTYECTGVESCVQSAIYSTCPGGKLMIVGMGNPVLTLPMSAASLREVDLVGVFRYANTYPRAIQLLASKNPLLPDLEKMITQRFRGMDRILQAFDMAAKTRDEQGNLVLKVMVDM